MNLTPLYIIPARGGSKGIPGKNIKPLGGKPLILHALDTARELGADNAHIILSTDSEMIADTARAAGYDVPFMRPAELATDTASSQDVLIHAVMEARRRGIDFDVVVLLQPTSPLRTAVDVRNALGLYSGDIDMVVSVTEARSNPYYNCFEVDVSTGYLHVSKGPGTYTRRQDAPPAWEYNGAVYVINPESLLTTPIGLMRRRIPSVMPPERSIDLDTQTDWLIAESLINSQYR